MVDGKGLNKVEKIRLEQTKFDYMVGKDEVSIEGEAFKFVVENKVVAKQVKLETGESLPLYLLFLGENVGMENILFTSIEEKNIQKYVEELSDSLLWFLKNDVLIYKSDFAIITAEYESIKIIKNVDVFAKYENDMMQLGTENHENALKFFIDFFEENVFEKKDDSK